MTSSAHKGAEALSSATQLPRSNGEGGWTLPFSLLEQIRAQAKAYTTELEDIESIALEVEKRILAGLPQGAASGAERRWMPIETAPKDETLVWLFEPHAAGGFMFAGLFDGKRRAWINNLDQQEQKPTHWMSLPDEPAPTDEDSSGGDDALTFVISVKDDRSSESPYAWSSIRSVPGTSIVDGGVMLLAETGECIGMVKVLMPRDGAVQNDVARALQTAGDPAKLQRFIRAARRGEQEANERAEIAEAALAALEGKSNG